MRSLALTALVWLVLTACGGGGSAPPGDSNGDPDPNPDPEPGTTAPTHAADIQPIWDQNCSGCHTNGGTNGGLALDNGHATLVDVASTELPTMDRVEPGDPAQSYLWHKLNGTQLGVGGSGGKMPLGGTLSTAELDTIEQWILGGAPP